HFANVTTFATRTVAVTAIAAVATVATITATIVTVVELATLTRLEDRIRRQDQRTFALCHFQQRCGQGFHIQL
ncbi:hypothetical protein, partial [Streptococcus pneumoniae]|uniref:hypothetical protein n=1 Tax=Streptococcus pneumoniae TaxID=1313 RepID=UPI0032972286